MTRWTQGEDVWTMPVAMEQQNWHPEMTVPTQEMAQIRRRKRCQKVNEFHQQVESTLEGHPVPGLHPNCRYLTLRSSTHPKTIALLTEHGTGTWILLQLTQHSAWWMPHGLCSPMPSELFAESSIKELGPPPSDSLYGQEMRSQPSSAISEFLASRSRFSIHQEPEITGLFSNVEAPNRGNGTVSKRRAKE